MLKSVYTDLAYDYVRKKILDGEYSPGQSLVTEMLAKEIKVSRTPVREALRKLESDGLVTIRAYLGAMVQHMQLKEFRDRFDVRLALESHAAGLAALNRTETELSELKSELDAMRKLSEQIIAASQESPLMSELMRKDGRFHIAIITAAKNELMKKEILRLHMINRVLMTRQKPCLPPVAKNDSDARLRTGQAAHDEIYRAIAHSDTMGAKRAMESHLQEFIYHNQALGALVQTGARARELNSEELEYNP